jgi:hypothetical protein
MNTGIFHILNVGIENKKPVYNFELYQVALLGVPVVDVVKGERLRRVCRTALRMTDFNLKKFILKRYQNDCECNYDHSTHQAVINQ